MRPRQFMILKTGQIQRIDTDGTVTIAGHVKTIDGREVVAMNGYTFEKSELNIISDYRE